MSDTETSGAERPDERMPIPPATFEYLTWSLRTQAEMHLGLLHFGEEKDRPAPELDLARHFVDLLAMLLDKTKGNLTVEEQRRLENAVTELRFRYVQAVEQSAKVAPTDKQD